MIWPTIDTHLIRMERIERAVLTILRGLYPQSVQWTMVSGYYLPQEIPGIREEQADKIAMDLEKEGLICFQPYGFNSVRYKSPLDKMCKITQEGMARLALLELEGRVMNLEDTKAAPMTKMGAGDSLDSRIAIHRLVEYLLECHPCDYTTFKMYGDALGVSQDVFAGIDDASKWNDAFSRGALIHQFLMNCRGRDERILQALLTLIFTDIARISVRRADTLAVTEKKISRLIKEMDLVLAPLGYAADVKLSRHRVGGVDVTLVMLSEPSRRSEITNLSKILKENYRTVREGLSAAYESAGSPDPKKARSAMDQCRNALSYVAEDLSGKKWREGGLPDLGIGGSGCSLIKEVYEYLSGKGWSHGRDHPSTDEIWVGIRSTETCLIHMLWSSGKWSGQ